jgi:hypothetical protein
MGRSHEERSMVVRVTLEVKEGRARRVLLTKEAIWGQTRGWRVEQMNTPIEGVWVDAIVISSCCRDE